MLLRPLSPGTRLPPMPRARPICAQGPPHGVIASRSIGLIAGKQPPTVCCCCFFFCINEFFEFCKSSFFTHLAGTLFLGSDPYLLTLTCIAASFCLVFFGGGSIEKAHSIWGCPVLYCISETLRKSIIFQQIRPRMPPQYTGAWTLLPRQPHTRAICAIIYLFLCYPR